MKRLRQTLDRFMDREVHADLQKATHSLSCQHAVDPDAVMEMIVNGKEIGLSVFSDSNSIQVVPKNRHAGSNLGTNHPD